MTDPTKRFSSRVENYIKYRPSYPPEMIALFVDRKILGKNKIVADIGSGTGILTRLLLPQVLKVYAVEPNREMRQAAERSLGNNKNFFSIEGRSESTTLKNESVNVITAAQAFHWFDIPRTKVEFRRILKPDGCVVVIWNSRVNDTPFLQEYEKGLQKFAVDYESVNHQNITNEDLNNFFDGTMEYLEFHNEQRLDLTGVLGRLNSSSYAPPEGSKAYKKLKDAIMVAFEKHAMKNRIAFHYLTQTYFGIFRDK